MQGQAKQSKIYRTEIMHMPIFTGGKKSEIYRTERLQMLIWTHKESKVKYAELNNRRCQYARTRKAKENMQN